MSNKIINLGIMSYMKLDAILFDLDGTLIRIPNNFLDLLNNIVRDTCKNLNVELNGNDINELWFSGENYKKILRKWGIKKKNYSLFWKIFDEKDLNLRKRLIKEGEIFLYDDSLPVLNKIKSHNGTKLGIISNTPLNKANFELEYFRLSKYFDCKIFLGSISQEHAKPEPDGILWCLDRLDKFVKKNSGVCYIGDSEIDIIAGKRASILTAYVVRDHNNKTLKIEPDIYLNSLYDIIDHLN
ncbi:MAG: HAD family hydrolase [Promethearchaeota archaeon]|nr:MAG: HAD family hydrolase [Candidatus Lokiarchaeota archaeon]